MIDNCNLEEGELHGYLEPTWLIETVRLFTAGNLHLTQPPNYHDFYRERGINPPEVMTTV